MIHSISLKKWTLKALVVVCFLGLLLPNITLFNEKENEAIIRKENRKITEFPRFNLLQKKFYPEFEKYYQDRLFGRDKLIHAWAKTNYKFDIMLKDNLVKGKNNHLFDINMNVKSFRDSDEKLKRIKDIQNYCSSQSVKFVLLLPPYKNAVYTDYMPSKYILGYPKYDIIENTVVKSCNSFNINYITLYQPLLNAKKNSTQDLYFPDDHHWSYQGSSVGADAVLKYIKTQFPKFYYDGMQFDGSFRDAYKECRYAKDLGIADSSSNRAKAPWSKTFTNEIYGIDYLTNKEVQFIDRPVSNVYLWSRMVNGEAVIINKQTKNHLKVLFLSDSYIGYMAPYLSQHIYCGIYTHYLDCAGDKKNTNLRVLLYKYKPDIVVLEMAAPSFLKSGKVSRFANLTW